MFDDATPKLTAGDCQSLRTARRELHYPERLTVQRYRLFSGLDIEFAEPEWDTLPLLARQWELTAYDAACLQLALKRNAPLVTLDARLAAAYDRAAARSWKT